MKKINLTSLIILLFIALICSPTSLRAGISRGGESNTNQGVDALHNNTSGNNNSAFGYQTLYNNRVGDFHTAVGSQALFNSVTIADVNGNVAVGFQALFSDTTGDSNNALGSLALFGNIDGIRNCALGTGALQSLTTGDSNTALGNAALSNSGTINFSTAVGRRALYRSQADQNTALGFFAGSNLRDGGTNDIYIGNVGPDPIGTESNTIRIGTQGTQTKTFIAGVSVTAVTGSTVKVNSNGQIGVAPSSERFKEAIQPMNNASEEIFSLQPVTFRYKPEVTKSGAAQFGLVAEEVAKVDPNLVVRDAKGQIQSVRYEAVNAMALNELIKEHRKVQDQQKQIDNLTAQLKEQASVLQKVSAQVDLMKTAPRTVADTR